MLNALISVLFSLIQAVRVSGSAHQLRRGCNLYVLDTIVIPVGTQCQFIRELRRTIQGTAASGSVALVFSTYSNLPLYCTLRSSSMSVYPPLTLTTISLDSQIHEFLKLQNVQSLLLNITSGKVNDIRYNAAERDIYQLISIFKQLVIYWTLSMNYNVLSLDTDIILLKNFLHLPRILSYDITGQGTFCRNVTVCSKVCGGLLFYRASNTTSRLVLQSAIRIVKMGRRSGPHQRAIWDAMKQTENLTVNLLPLDVTPFINDLVGCMGINLLPNAVAVHLTRHGNWGVRKWNCQKHTRQGRQLSYKALNATGKFAHALRLVSPTIGCPRILEEQRTGWSSHLAH